MATSQAGQFFDVVELGKWGRGKARHDRALGGVVPFRFETAGDPHPFFDGTTPTHVALQMQPGRRRVYELITIDLSAGVGRFRVPHVAQEQDE